MLGSLRKFSSRYIGGAGRSFIFFVLFYLYVWFCVDLRLMYYGAGVITNFPAFYKGWAFFRTFLSYPGCSRLSKNIGPNACYYGYAKSRFTS
jgi:hypothetical protein